MNDIIIHRGSGAGGAGGVIMYALGGGLAPPKMTDGIYQIRNSLIK